MPSRRILLGCAVALVGCATMATWWFTRSEPPTVQLRGEFERQNALLLSCRSFVNDSSSLFAELVAAASQNVPVLLIHTGQEERTAAEQILYAHGVSASNLQFLDVPHTTMWVRDFGPFVAEDADGRPVFIDTNYEWEEIPEIAAIGKIERVADDNVPRELAKRFGVDVRETRLTIDGGHLLSNGRGLGVASLGLLEHNVHHGLDEGQMRDELRQLFGFDDVVFLEKLPREPTGHADIFATFTSPDTIVLGELDPNTDPHGAAALDRNARKLAAVRVDGKPLNVVRIPMPYFKEGEWPTYTNVVYANGTLLMPVYPGRDAEGRKTARETYQRLLPDWQIVEVDAEWFLPRAGGPHCAVLNLGPLDLTPLRTGSSGPDGK